MATKNELPVPWQRRSAGRILAYPWAQWFDGSQWTITQGEDFTVTVDCMRNMIYRAVSQFADLKRVRTQVEADGVSITFQAFDFYQK